MMYSLQRFHIFWCLFYGLILFIIGVQSEWDTEYKTIETNDGKVRGVRKTTLIKEIDFYAFKGIPYAKSPTGELRFKVSFFG